MEELIFKASVDTGASVQDVEKLNKSLKSVDDSAKSLGKQTEATEKDLYKLGARFEDIYGELQPLSSRLGEIEDRMYELALAGKQNTDEFKALQSEVVRYRQTIIETDKAVDLLAEQGRGLGVALQIGTGITAGYGAIQGVVASIGIENENLEQTMVKLQAVQATLNALEQIKLTLDQKAIIMASLKAGWNKALTASELLYGKAVGTTTGAMKLLRLAMLALPIVAIIAGVVALVGWLVTMGDETKNLEEANDRLTESYDRQRKAFEASQKVYERDVANKIRLAKLQGASEEELLALEQKRLAVTETGRKQEVAQLKKHMNEQNELYIKAYMDKDYELAKSIREEWVANKQRYSELSSLDGQYNEDLRALNLEYKNKINADNEKAEQERLANAKEWASKRKAQREEEAKLRLEEQRALEDLINLNIQDEDLRRIMQLRTSQARELEELKNKYGEKSKLISETEIRQANERAALNEQLRNEEDERIKGHEDYIAQQRLSEQERQLTSERAFAEARLIQAKELSDQFYAQQMEIARIEMEQELLNTELTEGEKYKIKVDYENKIDELEAEKIKSRTERRKQAEDDINGYIAMGMNAIQGLSDAFFDNKLSNLEKGSDEELKVAKKQFQINKALQITQAIAQGIQATLAAYSSGSAIPVVGAVTGPAFAALAAATSLLSINKIKNQKFEGGGSATVSAPSASVSAPNIPVPEYGSSTMTAGLDGSSLPSTPTPSGNVSNSTIKVAVVDSDIKASLDGTTKVNSLSTIGG